MEFIVSPLSPWNVEGFIPFEVGNRIKVTKLIFINLNRMSLDSAVGIVVERYLTYDAVRRVSGKAPMLFSEYFQ